MRCVLTTACSVASSSSALRRLVLDTLWVACHTLQHHSNHVQHAEKNRNKEMPTINALYIQSCQGTYAFEDDNTKLADKYKKGSEIKCKTVSKTKIKRESTIKCKIASTIKWRLQTCAIKCNIATTIICNHSSSS